MYNFNVPNNTSLTIVMYELKGCYLFEGSLGLYYIKLK